MILGPNGVPVSSGPVQDVGPGAGGVLELRETSIIDFPGGVKVRFQPGRYLFCHEQDFDRIVANQIAALPKDS